jgi:uncharacterized protein YbjT (DUF2867 family)
MGDERLMAAERTVRKSGADWTIVRPSWFNQNFDEGVFRAAVMAGELAVPLGDLRQAFVDADDIAAVAAAALTEDGHAGQSYELTGPRALSFAEALEIVAGRRAGRSASCVPTRTTWPRWVRWASPGIKRCRRSRRSPRCATSATRSPTTSYDE